MTEAHMELPFFHPININPQKCLRRYEKGQKFAQKIIQFRSHLGFISRYLLIQLSSISVYHCRKVLRIFLLSPFLSLPVRKEFEMAVNLNVTFIQLFLTFSELSFSLARGAWRKVRGGRVMGFSMERIKFIKMKYCTTFNNFISTGKFRHFVTLNLQNLFRFFRTWFCGRSKTTLIWA